MTSLTLPRPGSAWLRAPALLPLLLVALVAILVVAPLMRIVLITLTPAGLDAWVAVLASPLSANLWWKPLATTLTLGFAVPAGCLLIGGFLA